MAYVSYMKLAGGFLLLLVCSGLLGGQMEALARRMRVSLRVVGITLLSLVTTLPEITLALHATSRGGAVMAVGAAIGSTLANLLLIVGLLAILRPLVVRRGTTGVAFPLTLLGILAFLFLGMDSVFSYGRLNELTLGDGLVLLGLVGLFIYFPHYTAWRKREENAARDGVEGNADGVVAERESGYRGLFSLLALLLLSALGVGVGSYFAVDGALEVTNLHNLPQETMGLAVMALFVALPEIVVAFTQRRSEDRELVFGNLLGASFYNLTLVPGLASLVAPLPLYQNALSDLLMVLVGVLLLMIFVAHHGERVITRVEGILLLAFYLFVLGFSVVSTSGAVRVLF